MLRLLLHSNIVCYQSFLFVLHYYIIKESNSDTAVGVYEESTESSNQRMLLPRRRTKMYSISTSTRDWWWSSFHLVIRIILFQSSVLVSFGYIWESPIRWSLPWSPSSQRCSVCIFCEKFDEARNHEVVLVMMSLCSSLPFFGGPHPFLGQINHLLDVTMRTSTFVVVRKYSIVTIE